MIPTSKYFSPKELIQPSLFESLTVSALMNCIGYDTINSLDMLRADYEGAVKASRRYRESRDAWININGMYYGTEFKHSGLRSIDCPEGVTNSVHKTGRAFDLKARHMDILLSLILDNYNIYSIGRIESPELTVFRGWLHIEIDQSSKELVIFNP